MPIRLVPPSEPDAKQAVVERVKQLRRPDGVIQCPRCGSRTIMTAVNGASLKDGRKQGGTTVVKDACADCWKKGLTVQMIPDPPKLVKPENPKRPKLKSVESS